MKGRSEELERLAVEMYARGCSTRDIEAIFRDGAGRSLLSKSAVSELTEVLWAEYEESAGRDLSEIGPLYLFLDGIAERLRPGAKREAVLCGWAITWEGRKVLIHLAPGSKESTDCCREFLQDLQRRGLRDPVLVVTDGAAGLIRAVEECFPNGRLLYLFAGGGFSSTRRCSRRRVLGVDDPAHYLLTTVELPLSGQIVAAAPEEPYLSLRLVIAAFTQEHFFASLSNDAERGLSDHVYDFARCRGAVEEKSRSRTS